MLVSRLTHVAPSLLPNEPKRPAGSRTGDEKKRVLAAGSRTSKLLSVGAALGHRRRWSMTKVVCWITNMTRETPIRARGAFAQRRVIPELSRLVWTSSRSPSPMPPLL